MSYKNLKIALAIISVIATTGIAFAHEQAIVEKIPSFFVFELIGAVLSLITLAVSIYMMKITAGGILAKLFKTIVGGLGFITIGLLARSAEELFVIESIWIELLFEIPLYLGLLTILIGLLKTKKGLTG